LDSPLSPTFFFGFKFPNLAILVGKKMGKIVQIQEKMKKKFQKFEIRNKKRLLLKNKFLKIIIIIPTLNT
jgi:uncharacterized membrane protein YqgA involved in biofilm formation